MVVELLNSANFIENIQTKLRFINLRTILCLEQTKFITRHRRTIQITSNIFDGTDTLENLYSLFGNHEKHCTGIIGTFYSDTNIKSFEYS